MKEIIREFLEATPVWLGAIELQAKIAWKNQSCMLCGMNYQKMKELYEALAEDYGPIKIKIIK